ncbi:hypothetical protein [uncultured Anaerofustis sp.]|nr:hypothetical protein [uncultured Anaerofustis sp.]
MLKAKKMNEVNNFIEGKSEGLFYELSVNDELKIKIKLNEV